LVQIGKLAAEAVSEAAEAVSVAAEAEAVVEAV